MASKLARILSLGSPRESFVGFDTAARAAPRVVANARPAPRYSDAAPVTGTKLGSATPAVEVPSERMRRALDPDEATLRVRTGRWMHTLPADVRPVATAEAYARVVNRIADLWSHCEYTRLHFQSLLVERRKGRRGFPPEVQRELVALQRYYQENLSCLPPILWNAVPVHAPRIPHTAYPPLPITDEIDIPPVLR